MKQLCLYSILILLLAACQSNDKGYADEMPPLFPAPQSFPLNLEDGYKVNPVTGQSIEPLINSLGDTVITGRPIPAKGKVVDMTLMPKPKVVRAGKPRVVAAHANVNKIPDELTVIPVNKDSLKTFTPGVDSSSFVLVNSMGDTIPTGVPIPVKGKVVPYQHPKPVKAGSPRYKDVSVNNIQYIDTDQGLNLSFITSIMQDRNGNIWFATFGNCVSKYDGESFTSYSESNGLSDKYVLSLLEDINGNIWFGTNGGGVCKYDGEKFIQYTEKEGLSNNAVRSILEDKYGNLWFGTGGGGVSKYDGRTFTHFTKKEGLSSNYVNSIMEDKYGNLWFGTWGGFNKYDGEKFIQFSEEGGLTNNSVRSILEDKYGNLWFGTIGNGVCKYDGESFTYYTENEGLSNNKVNSIIEDKNGNLWFGTEGDVDKFDGENITHYTEKEGLSKNMVRSILEDNVGNLWFGTWGGGVNKLNDESFSHFTKKEGMSYIIVSAILEDKNGNLWIGTDVGVNKYDGKSFTLYTENEGLLNNEIYSSLEDKNGNLWFGTGAGVNKFDGENFEVYGYKEGTYATTFAILEDKDGNLWFGTWKKGVSKYDGKRVLHFTDKEGLSNNIVYSILEDKKGNLWFGTEGGVTKYDGKSFTHITEREGLSNNTVHSIFEDKNENLWFGTNGGLNKYDGERFTYYTESEGLTNNAAVNILLDNKENLWVGTEKGLNCLRGGYIKNHHEIKLEKSSGLSIVEVNTLSGLKGMSFFLGGALLDSNNKAWWGSEKGVNMLDMNTFSFADEPPVVRLSYLEIEGRFIDYRNLKEEEKSKIKFDSVARFENYPLNLELPFNRNHITFHFSAIDWAAPHQIKYSYIIPGVDKKWNPPTEEAKADYRNLPNGTHTLIVRAIGESMEWSEPFEYTLTILPPWWRSKAIIGGYFLLAIGMIWSYTRWRTRSLLIQKAALEQTVKERTIALEAQKERAERSEKYKEQFLANMSHEIRTPMHAILGMTNILSRNKHPGQMDMFLNAIKRSSENLLVLLNDILDLSKIEAGKIKIESITMQPVMVAENVVEVLRVEAVEKGLDLNLTVNKNVPKYTYGDPARLAQILLNLVGNAIKFTEKGGVEITIDKKKNKMVYAVQDSGIGIPKDKQENIFGSFEQGSRSNTKTYSGTGLGLSISKQLVELQDGKIWVESEENVGSTFFFELPFKPVEVDQKLKIELSKEDLHIMAGELRGIKVLLAEDNKFNVMIAGDDLSYYIEDVNIDIAENGQKAIEGYLSGNYDLILMDIQMPELNGYDATKAIRELEAKNDKIKSIPIIAMTASLLKTDIDKCYESGMDNYIPKPYKIEELIGTIHKVIVAQN